MSTIDIGHEQTVGVFTVRRRAHDDWMAYITELPGAWGCGRSIDAAIGSVVRSFPERFSIVQHPDPA